MTQLATMIETMQMPLKDRIDGLVSKLQMYNSHRFRIAGESGFPIVYDEYTHFEVGDIHMLLSFLAGGHYKPISVRTYVFSGEDHTNASDIGLSISAKFEIRRAKFILSAWAE